MDEALQNLDGQDLTHPFQAQDIHTYRYGDVIVREGEETQYFFVILSGQVRITQRGKNIRLLEEQDVFGLENAVIGRPSLYTGRALCKSRIATYGPQAVDYLIRKSPRMVQSILLSILHQLTQTTFNLSGESDAFTLDEFRVNFYSDGDIIIQENTKGTDFFRLVSTQGGLKVTVRGEEVARIEKPGQFFGEIAGLLHLPHDSTITSVGESVVESYGPDDLDVIVKDHPERALRIMRTLISRITEEKPKITGIPAQ